MRRFLCWLFRHRFRLSRATMLRDGAWLLSYTCLHCGASKSEAVVSLIDTLAAKLGIRERDL